MPIEFTPETVIVASSDQISCDLGNEAVVLQCSKGIYYGCTPVAAFIWRFVQQPRTFADITNQVLGEYDVEPQQCDTDVRGLLDDLASAGLIVVNSPNGSNKVHAVR